MNTQKTSKITLEVTPKQLKLLITILELLIKTPNRDTYCDLLRYLRSRQNHLQIP